MTMHLGKVYILILNYKTWQDTLECLESIWKSSRSNYQVVIVDNCSENQSLEQIADYLSGNSAFSPSPNPGFDYLVFPLEKKPIPFVRYLLEEFKDGGNKEMEDKALANRPDSPGGYPAILVQNNENRGFAAGNNLGLDFILKRNDCRAIWLINNDTVIDTDALLHLANRLELLKRRHVKPGIIGSKVLFYDKADTIQYAGGSAIHRSLSFARPLGQMEKDTGQWDREMKPGELDYVIGAAMFLTPGFLRETGLMCEDYFLYWEELDWSERGKKNRRFPDYCFESVVYHKQGVSTDRSLLTKKKSPLSEYYDIRNRMVVWRKFFGWRVFNAYLSNVVILFNRIRRGEWNKVPVVFRAILDSFKV